MQKYCGYVFNEQALADYLGGRGGLYFRSAPVPAGLGKGKEAFLWEVEQHLTGQVRPPHSQDIGDCVSHGFTGASEDLQFIQMLKKPGFQFRWLSSEYTYGVARIQVGQGGCGYGDGAVVAWAFEAGQKFGLLPRDVYGNYDLRNYNSHYAKEWGTPRVGSPDALVSIAKSHLTVNCFLIEGNNKYEQACDALAAGGLIVTGSNQLYSSSRDQQGFCSRNGHGGHCTYYRGFSDNAKRPGIVYQQSWGPDIPAGGEQQITLPSGKVITLPKGAFFIDAENFEYMHSGSQSEVWAVVAEDGWLLDDEQSTFAFHTDAFTWASAA